MEIDDAIQETENLSSTTNIWDRGKISDFKITFILKLLNHCRVVILVWKIIKLATWR